MAGFNQVILLGNLTRDCEVRTTPSGVNITNFGLAVNEKRKDQEKVHFIECTAFGKTGEVMAQYLAKGSSVLVDGKLDYQSWEQDGQKRNKLGVVVNGFTFVDSKKSEAPSEVPSEPVSLEDIPF